MCAVTALPVPASPGRTMADHYLVRVEAPYAVAGMEVTGEGEVLAVAPILRKDLKNAGSPRNAVKLWRYCGFKVEIIQVGELDAAKKAFLDACLKMDRAAACPAYDDTIKWERVRLHQHRRMVRASKADHEALTVRKL